MSKSDNVVREFSAIGKYRIRILGTGKGQVLDLREYISTKDFEGFTRRGVRLAIPKETYELRQIVYTLPAAPKKGAKR